MPSAACFGFSFLGKIQLRADGVVVGNIGAVRRLCVYVVRHRSERIISENKVDRLSRDLFAPSVIGRLRILLFRLRIDKARRFERGARPSRHDSG